METPACSDGHLDLTTPRICSVAELVAFYASLNGTSNCFRSRLATASPQRSSARAAAQVAGRIFCSHS